MADIRGCDNFITGELTPLMHKLTHNLSVHVRFPS
jgi:hypothetical protein